MILQKTVVWRLNFLHNHLATAAQEPEGIYLSLPLVGECRIIQSWGDSAEFYHNFCYNGVPLKGHNGIDFQTTPGATVHAVDGRVVELGNELQGFGRYIKVEHGWGESLYANVGDILVDSGQLVRRNDQLAQTNSVTIRAANAYLHFSIRIKPYNRFDGWGGFCDPVPFLNPTHLHFVNINAPLEIGSSHRNALSSTAATSNVSRDGPHPPTITWLVCPAALAARTVCHVVCRKSMYLYPIDILLIGY